MSEILSKMINLLKEGENMNVDGNRILNVIPKSRLNDFELYCQDILCSEKCFAEKANNPQNMGLIVSFRMSKEVEEYRMKDLLSRLKNRNLFNAELDVLLVFYRKEDSEFNPYDFFIFTSWKQVCRSLSALRQCIEEAFGYIPTPISNYDAPYFNRSMHKLRKEFGLAIGKKKCPAVWSYENVSIYIKLMHLQDCILTFADLSGRSLSHCENIGFSALVYGSNESSKIGAVMRGGRPALGFKKLKDELEIEEDMNSEEREGYFSEIQNEWQVKHINGIIDLSIPRNGMPEKMLKFNPKDVEVKMENEKLDEMKFDHIYEYEEVVERYEGDHDEDEDIDHPRVPMKTKKVYTVNTPEWIMKKKVILPNGCVTPYSKILKRRVYMVVGRSGKEAKSVTVEMLAACAGFVHIQPSTDSKENNIRKFIIGEIKKKPGAIGVVIDLTRIDGDDDFKGKVYLGLLETLRGKKIDTTMYEGDTVCLDNIFYVVIYVNNILRVDKVTPDRWYLMFLEKMNGDDEYDINYTTIDLSLTKVALRKPAAHHLSKLREGFNRIDRLEQFFIDQVVDYRTKEATLDREKYQMLPFHDYINGLKNTAHSSTSKAIAIKYKKLEKPKRRDYDSKKEFNEAVDAHEKKIIEQGIAVQSADSLLMTYKKKYRLAHDLSNKVNVQDQQLLAFFHEPVPSFVGKSLCCMIEELKKSDFKSFKCESDPELDVVPMFVERKNL